MSTNKAYILKEQAQVTNVKHMESNFTEFMVGGI